MNGEIRAKNLKLGKVKPAWALMHELVLSGRFVLNGEIVGGGASV